MKDKLKEYLKTIPTVKLPIECIKKQMNYFEDYDLAYNSHAQFQGIIYKDRKSEQRIDVPTDVTFNTKTKQFAISLKPAWIPDDYFHFVNEKILNIDFQPDIFQRQAFYMLARNESVFITAHTSSGKTLVAEYAIRLAQENNTRVIYTSPIKSLSNQKYYDFKDKFEDVGLITGDVQVNPNANVIIMTTEILRNMLYRQHNILKNVEYVVFDEIHYINDRERGVVWEECLISLPQYITLILLSATIPNSVEFAAWIGRTKNKTVYVIGTNKRAVPLEFFIFENRKVYPFGSMGIKKMEERKKLETKKMSETKKKIESKKKIENSLEYILKYLKKENLLPTIFFCFSKRRCEEHARSLQSNILTTADEQKEISQILTQALKRLNQSDRNLPQIQRMFQLLLHGIGVHHGAILPILKEAIEILFSLNLVKVLIATETFAMGVNMPARSVVFLTLKKMDGDTSRWLHAGEYTQMSGRAGRRGLDHRGVVLIAGETPPPNVLQQIAFGTPPALYSKFKLSFGMMLALLQHKMKVEDVIKMSFGENDIQKMLISEMEKVNNLEEQVKDIKTNNTIEKYLDVFEDFIKINNKLRKSAGLETTFEINLPRFPHCIIKKTGNFLYDIINKNYIGEDKNIENEIIPYIENDEPFFDYKFTDSENVLLTLKIREKWDQLNKMWNDNLSEIFELYTHCRKKRMIQNEINNIKSKFDNGNFIGEYFKRIDFLKTNNYLDNEKNLIKKGRVASCIKTVNEILVTEMLFNGDFNVSPELSRFNRGTMILVLFSSMVHNEKLDDDDDESKEIKKNIGYINSKIELMCQRFDAINTQLIKLGIPKMKELNWDLAECIYDWCIGKSFGEIVEEYGVGEGALVRIILRLDECSREMIGVCQVLGDDELCAVFEEMERLIRRDIVFTPSLYL
ncbi:putative ATP-dependent RNA helicase [Astathelohania contejeani]|uniref:ATP-dependent RNA helicase n=1 Tax=Astathelohania contejeani TaxID=164912 RepID=A0ABQ7HZG2_9MICR|nr:putative ATP-dependent RNA helicase [Thelohania contejeani]